jgi:hypothetical protein
VFSAFPRRNIAIANFIIAGIAVMALSCCSPAPTTTTPPVAPVAPTKPDSVVGEGMPDVGKVYNRLSDYADDLSAISKRRTVKELPTNWTGMMELAKAEIDSRQWDLAKAHLNMAAKMAPNAASRVLTKGQVAIIEAKRGRYADAISYLDALIESPDVAGNDELVNAVQTMRATINQHRISGHKLR